MTRERSCVSYTPWRMMFGAVVGVAGLGIWVFFTNLMFKASRELRTDFSIVTPDLYRHVEQGSIALAVIFCVATVLSLALGIWRSSISKDVDASGTASNNARFFDLMATVLVTVFVVISVLAIFVAAGISMVGTSGMYIYGAANVAENVGDAMKQGGYTEARSNSGVCRPSCIDLSRLVGAGLQFQSPVQSDPCYCGRDHIDHVKALGMIMAGSTVYIVLGLVLQYLGSTWMSQSLTAASARTIKEAELLLQQAREAQVLSGKTFPITSGQGGNTV